MSQSWKDTTKRNKFALTCYIMSKVDSTSHKSDLTQDVLVYVKILQPDCLSPLWHYSFFTARMWSLFKFKGKIYIAYRHKSLHHQHIVRTGIRNFEPRSSSEDSLTCICASVETILVLLRWENVSYSENETQEPRYQDGHNDLGTRKRKYKSDIHKNNYKKTSQVLILNTWAH